MRCIFCRQETAGSEEHIIPDALGGTISIRAVCKPCNSKLGHEVDDTLVNSFPAQLARFTLNIPNRDGKVPNPFGAGTTEDGRRVQVDIKDGIPTPKLHITKEKTETGERWTIPAEDVAALPKMLARERKRHGQPELSTADLDAEVKRLLAKAEHHSERPMIQHAKPIDVSGWPAALQKMAYEFAWYWLGDDCLDDPAMMSLRQSLLSGTPSPAVRGRCALGGGETKPPFIFWADQLGHHIAFLTEAEGQYFVGVRILNLCHLLVSVGKAPLRLRHGFDGNFLSIDPVTGSTEERSFVDEIERIGTAMDNDM
jgi:hypothetical protein